MEHDILKDYGPDMYHWATDLFPINRSLTGSGVRQTLDYLRNIIPNLEVHSVASGTKVFDWIIPDEWHVQEAWIKAPDGRKIVDFSEHNLHLVGYSVPISAKMSLSSLKNKLISLPELPTAIPYATSYYNKDWGFCISHKQLNELEEGDYEVLIDSKLFKGCLNYGEVYIPGDLSDEVLISTYICHPSMANNELSGPVVATALAKILEQSNKNRYSYRFVFVPETIGAIAYIHKNLASLKDKVIAGFNLTCIGDDREYSFLPSRNGSTLSDRAAILALREASGNNVKHYSWLERGSDERQYCSPGVDLPIASIMRSKYGEYPEYHTSLDNLDVISPTGLAGGLAAVYNAIDIIEKNARPLVNCLCEPQLGKRGLYENLSVINPKANSRNLLNIISLSDGTNDLIDLCDKLELPFKAVWELTELLKSKDLIKT